MTKKKNIAVITKSPVDFESWLELRAYNISTVAPDSRRASQYDMLIVDLRKKNATDFATMSDVFVNKTTPAIACITASQLEQIPDIITDNADELLFDIKNTDEILYRIKKILDKAVQTTTTIRSSFYNMLHFTPIGAVVLDKNSQVLDANQAAVSMVNSPSLEELKKRKLTDIDTLKASGATDLFFECLQKQIPATHEGQYTSTWGRTFFYKVSLIPLPTDFFNNEVALMFLEDRTQLRNNELLLNKFKTISDNNPIGIVITNTQTKIEYVNKTMCEMTGYTEHELLGKKSGMLKSGEQGPEFYKHLWKTLQSGNPWQGYFINKRKDGSHYYELAVIAPVLDDNNQTVQYIGMKVDITKQKQIEKALRKSNAKFKLLAENSSDAILLVENDIIQYVSPAYENFLGVPAHEITGLGVMEIFNYIHPEDRQRVANIIADSRKNKEKLSKYAFRIQKKDGDYIWVEDIVKRTYTDNDTVERVVINSRKIDDRIKIEQELQQSRELYKIIVDYTYNWEIFQDAQGHIKYCNPAIEKITGYTPTDYLDGIINLEKITISEDKEQINAQIQLLKGGNAIENFEFKIRHKQGQIKYCQFSAQPVIVDGQFQGVRSSISDITKNKDIENALTESEEKLRNLVSQSTDGIIIINADGIIVEWNSALTRITGLQKVDVLYKQIYEIQNLLYQGNLDTSKLTKLYESVKKATKTGTSSLFYIDYEIPIIDLAGNKHVVQSSIFPIKTPNAYYIGSIIREITEQKQAEEAMRESEQRYKLLSELTFEGILLHKDGIAIEVNDAFARMVKYAKNELIGKNIVGLLVSNQSDIDLIKQNMVQDYASPYRINLMRKDGVNLPVEIEAKNINWHGNTYRVAAIRDITERVMAENQQKENNRQFKQLGSIAVELLQLREPNELIEYTCQKITQNLEASITIFYEYNRGEKTARIVAFSGNWDTNLYSAPQLHRYQMLVGSTLEFNKPVHEVFPAESLVRYEKMEIQQSDVLKNTKLQYYIDLHRNYGKSIHTNSDYSLAVHIIMPAVARSLNRRFIESLINQFSLILQQKNLETRLFEAKNQAEQANVAKSAFLANMSHEIRTPLNAILGFTDILYKRTKEPDFLANLGSIRSSGKLLLNLFNDILDLSKIESNKLEISVNPVNIRKKINEIAAVFRQSAHNKGLHWAVNIQNIPEIVYLDEQRFRQILFNLLGNAVKFTHQGSISLNVKAEKRNKSNKTMRLIITVKDTGIGIDKAYHQEIFMAFRQRDEKDTRSYGGTGLGLALTKRLVDIMDGTIEVKSELGKGSEFIVTFDNLLNYDDEENKSYETEDDAFYNDIIFKNSKVLIVDDILINRVILREYIKKRNVVIFEAADGKEAIELCKQEMPDVVLLDLRMPAMDGNTVCNTIRKTMPETKVIAVTAFPDTDLPQKHCFDKVLQKPVAYNSLIKVLIRFLPYSVEKPDEFATEALQSEYLHLSPSAKTEILEHFTTHTDQQWENITRTNSLNEIDLFARSFISLGQNHNLPTLVNYGNIIIEFINQFNIHGILDMLPKYQTIKELLINSLNDKELHQ